MTDVKVLYSYTNNEDIWFIELKRPWLKGIVSRDKYVSWFIVTKGDSSILNFISMNESKRTFKEGVLNIFDEEGDFQYTNGQKISLKSTEPLDNVIKSCLNIWK